MDAKTHNLALLVRPDVTTIECTFSQDDEHGHGKRYTFVALRELADELKSREAYVIVQCFERGIGMNYKVVRVVGVHEEPQIDIEAGFHYRWAFQRVLEHELAAREFEQEDLAERIGSARRRSQREQALHALGLDDLDVTKFLAAAKTEKADD